MVLNATVERITRVAGGHAARSRTAPQHSYTLQYSSPAANQTHELMTEEQTFDVVFIAAPLEQTGFEFAGMAPMPPGADLNRDFFDWHVTVVEAAAVNESQFAPFWAMG